MTGANGRGQQWAAYGGLVIAVCTALYSAGAQGQRVESLDARVEKLEAEQDELSGIKERLARIEARLDVLIENQVGRGG